MLNVDGLVKIYKTDYGDVQAVKGVSFEVACLKQVSIGRMYDYGVSLVWFCQKYHSSNSICL